jgi:hypothetical protein
MKIGLYSAVVFKKSRHIDDEIPDDWEIRKGLNQNGFP